ncbi:murein biosynthesis integral membrane protein MurJ [Kitasatospora viridis]|uniref:Putative peptidoglycan lipid II flippase n=1 Tax=Kitasatospora viridis TaxID=281105 RepID=A0A561UG44_9ACTN|nr:murein biosynthesis integral membrane protein MurJ [Kitasatospora viridis]TWF98318.1 putative peptidoglycan lipid II flippase [Kitasatospora viridis]
MTTHTAGEPYGSYGSSESHGAAQPYPAMPEQGQPDPQQPQFSYDQPPPQPQPSYGYEQQPAGYPEYQQPLYQDPPPQQYEQARYEQTPYEQAPYEQPQSQPQYEQQQPYQQYPAYQPYPGPEQHAHQYQVSEPYLLPADYGLPHTFNDPPTMSLRAITAQEQYLIPPAPTAPPQLPHQRPAEPAAPPQARPEQSEDAAAGRNGLIMAIGTLASRGLGFVRTAMLVAALGPGILGSAFNVANTLPNIVFTMLIGGALQSIFVPELVKAAKNDADGGVAYTDRLLTLCTVALGLLTIVSVLIAPWLVNIYAGDWTGSDRSLTVSLARFCLPEIFFYGLFTLLGQVLNARGKFGAMMWTPVLNNVVACAVFGLYIAIGGQAASTGAVTTGQTWLLGLGTLLGVVVQALGLVPSLRAVKFRWTPRFDWRGAGLGAPIKAATWALLLVIVTQVAFTEITALTTAVDHIGGDKMVGIGNASYTYASTLFLVPQGVITISMVTAIMPQMSRAATEGNLQKIGADLARVLRNSAAMIITATVLFIAFSDQITHLAYGYGHQTKLGLAVISGALLAFAIGIPFFCAQYALARGFYAMGDARTPFWLTVVSSGSNVFFSYLAYVSFSPRWIIVGMAAAQSIACVINMLITGFALARRLRSLPAAPEDPQRRAEVLRAALRQPMRSGLDGRRVFGLHLGLLLACLPGALVGHFLAAAVSGAISGGVVASTLGNGIGLVLGTVTVLVSLFLLAKPLGAASTVAPLARKLRLPFPAEPEPSGRRRRA